MKIEYDEISPISGDKTVILEVDPDRGVESRLCIATGYTSREDWIDGSEAVKRYESQASELVRASRFVDDDKRVWYYAVIVTPQASLYPIGNDQFSAEWFVAPIINIKSSEREQYPIPGKPGEYYHTRIAEELGRKYPINEFENALEQMYSIIYTMTQNIENFIDNHLNVTPE